MNILSRLFKPNVPKLKRKRNIPALIKAIKHSDQSIRYASTCALLRLGAIDELVQIGPSVMGLLTHALKDPYPSVRQSAVVTLGQIGDTRVVQPLIALLEDTNSDVSQTAAQALGQISDARAIEPLIAVCKDKDSDVRQAASRALGQLGDTGAVEPLIAALEDKNSNVRQTAAQALGQLGDARAIEPLIAVRKDKDSDVRQAAAQTLDKLGWKPGTNQTSTLYFIAKREWDKCVEIGQPAVEPLIAFLEDVEMCYSQPVYMDVTGALERITGQRPKIKSRIILIIDDDREMMGLGTLILERSGFKTLRAYNGIDGLEILNNEYHRIGVVLLDIMMIGMDGWQVLGTIRSSEKLAQIPVIMLTARHYLKDESETSNYAHLFDGYVVKSFVVRDLLGKINNLIYDREKEWD